jgi:hypothetical protein
MAEGELSGKMEIENLGRLPAAVVRELRELLDQLATPEDSRAVPDPARRGCFILRGERHSFYVALTPSARKMLLLASWPACCPAFLDCAAD